MSTATYPQYTYTDAEIDAHRATWVAALRDGRYLQAHETLRLRLDPSATLIGYCCLGVAEDLRGCVWHENAGSNVEFRINESSDESSYREYTTGELTVTGQRWFGLKNADPVIVFVDTNGDWTYQCLTVLNDQGEYELDTDDDEDDSPLPWDFDEIADVVELQPPGWDGTHDFAKRYLDARHERMRS